MVGRPTIEMELNCQDAESKKDKCTNMGYEADTCIQKAKEKFHNRDVEGAIQELNQAIQFNPNNIEYHLLRGDYLFKLDRYKLASEDFRKVIGGNQDINDLEIAYGWLSHCHAALGQFHEAILDLDWLTERGFADATRYGWRGDLKMKIGDVEGAINDYTTAHQMSPDAEVYLLKLAQANTAKNV